VTPFGINSHPDVLTPSARSGVYYDLNASAVIQSARRVKTTKVIQKRFYLPADGENAILGSCRDSHVGPTGRSPYLAHWVGWPLPVMGSMREGETGRGKVGKLIELAFSAGLFFSDVKTGGSL
jgi:hypothetical protein